MSQQCPKLKGGVPPRNLPPSHSRRYYMAMTGTTTPPTSIRVVRFDIRSIPKKPPAPSVRRRVKAKRRSPNDDRRNAYGG